MSTLVEMSKESKGGDSLYETINASNHGFELYMLEIKEKQWQNLVTGVL